MLLGSFFVKLFFIVVEVGLAIAFGVTEYKGSYNISAIFEWVVALVYIFCKSSLLTSIFVTATDHKANIDFSVDVWSYALDFLPVNYGLRTRSKELPEARKGSDEMVMTNQLGGPAFTS